MAVILQSPLAARGSCIFSAYFSVNCLLHISINYTENVTDLYMHAQAVDTRRSSLNFEAPRYEAMYFTTEVLVQCRNEFLQVQMRLENTPCRVQCLTLHGW